MEIALYLGGKSAKPLVQGSGRRSPSKAESVLAIICSISAYIFLYACSLTYPSIGVFYIELNWTEVNWWLRCRAAYRTAWDGTGRGQELGQRLIQQTRLCRKRRPLCALRHRPPGIDLHYAYTANCTASWCRYVRLTTGEQKEMNIRIGSFERSIRISVGLLLCCRPNRLIAGFVRLSVCSPSDLCLWFEKRKAYRKPKFM